MTCGKLHSLHQQGLLLAAEGIRMMEHTSPEPIMGSTAWLRRGLRRWLRDSPFPDQFNLAPAKSPVRKPPLTSDVHSYLHSPFHPDPTTFFSLLILQFHLTRGVCLFTCLFQSTLSLLHISLRSPRLFYENLMTLWEVLRKGSSCQPHTWQ